MTEWDFASQVLQWICAGSWSDGLSKVIVIILCGCVVVQIAPCKAKPITSAVKAAGTALTADVAKQLTDLQAHISEREMLDARNRILRFADECRRKELHSKEFFEQVLEDIDRYEMYCAAHLEFKNSKCVDAIAVIKEAHRECERQNSYV